MSKKNDAGLGVGPVLMLLAVTIAGIFAANAAYDWAEVYFSDMQNPYPTIFVIGIVMTVALAIITKLVTRGKK